MHDAVIDLADLGISRQEFESALFGAPVWKLAPPADVDFREIVSAARSEQVALISCRLPENDRRVVQAEAAGLRLIERLVTFEYDLGGVDAAVGLLAGPENAAECGTLAKGMFSFDRFHADPAVSNEIADEIKKRWVLNGVRGRANASLIVREAGTIAGFSLCLRDGDVATIDLIGVGERYRGKGFGRELVRATVRHFADACRVLRVGTQQNNAASISLYESEGFLHANTALTYHWTPGR